MGGSRAFTAALLATAVLVGTAPAGMAPAEGPAERHRARYKVIRGHDVPETPNELDRIAFVRHWFGGKSPGTPKAVLILVPGFLGGAEDFRYVGRRLVTRLPWLQVWAVDRRNNLLENRCGMEGAQAAGSPFLAAGYYVLGLPLSDCPALTDPDPAVWNGVDQDFSLSQEEAVSLGMARWGLETELLDIRRLIGLAHRRYPEARVFLGGHSLGGMTAQLYAAWRFGKRPATAGWHDIDGVVLIDGGVNGPAWQSVLLPQYVRERFELVDRGTVFWDDLAGGATPLLGLLAEIAGMAASLRPTEESFLWRDLPPPVDWPDPATCPTNRALFAALTDDQFAFDPGFELHQGELLVPADLDGDGQADRCAPPNQDRLLAHWRDFDRTSPPELSSTDVFAEALWRSTVTNGVEWYFSIMLNADVDLAFNLNSRATFPHPVTGEPTTAARLEGHRVFDVRRVAIPVYAFAAQECVERFEWFTTVATSVPSFTIVDRSKEGCPAPASEPHAHLDPLFAFDEDGFENDFIATVADWLEESR